MCLFREHNRQTILRKDAEEAFARCVCAEVCCVQYAMREVVAVFLHVVHPLDI